MRISSEKIRYLHPVYSTTSGDYDVYDADFGIEVTQSSAEIRVQFNFRIGNEALQIAIEKKQLLPGFFVVCQNTMFNRFMDISIGSGNISLDANQFYGRVDIQPVCCVLDAFDFTRHESINKEFPEIIGFQPNSLAVIGTVHSFNVEPKNFSLSAIFIVSYSKTPYPNTRYR